MLKMTKITQSQIKHQHPKLN